VDCNFRCLTESIVAVRQMILGWLLMLLAKSTVLFVLFFLKVFFDDVNSTVLFLLFYNLACCTRTSVFCMCQ
jgi:hypothetical protein